MPGDLLHQFLGFDHSSRICRPKLKQQRCLFGVADHGPRDVCSDHMLEQLGDNEGDLQ